MQVPTSCRRVVYSRVFAVKTMIGLVSLRSVMKGAGTFGFEIKQIRVNRVRRQAIGPTTVGFLSLFNAVKTGRAVCTAWW